jgi:C4-dicarboxylate transporter DctM subunit
MELLFISLALLLLGNVPIAVALGVSSFLFLWFNTDVPMTIIPQRMFNGTEGFTLLAVPLFMLAGNLMDRGGLSLKIVNFASSLVGFIRGGLAMISIVSAMFFAGISGSANADTAAIGSLLVPAMKKKEYDPGLAASILSSAGSIGVIIPPSIPMVVYASIANVSVGKMFLGGLIPGVLVGLALMVVSYFIAIKHNLPAEIKASAHQVWVTFKDAALALGMPLVILGGLFSGMFTATECAAIAVFYSFVVGYFIYRQLKLSEIWQICLDSAVTTGIPMLVVATCTVFAWIMASQQVPDAIATTMFSFTDSKYVMLLIFNLILLILGTFMDALPAIVLTTPVMLEIAGKYGLDPVFIGVIMVFNLAIGFSTPPVGVTLFVSCSIAKIRLVQTFKYLFYYIGAMLTVLFLVTYIPQLILFLPDLLIK